MYKLDNKGWSLTTMICFLVVLIFFILLISILVYHLGIEEDSPKSIYDTETNVTDQELLDN